MIVSEQATFRLTESVFENNGGAGIVIRGSSSGEIEGCRFSGNADFFQKETGCRVAFRENHATVEANLSENLPGFRETVRPS